MTAGIILLIAALAVIGMAKRTPKRRKNFTGYTRGNVRETLSLGTLAAATLVSIEIGSVDRPTRIGSFKALWSMSGYTVIDNAGPIMVGLAHGDYSDTEIAEWVQQTEATSWDSADLVAKEISSRRIRRVGVFGQVGQSLGAQVLNEGRQITTKLNWKMVTGQGISIWAFNIGSAAVGTTVPIVAVDGHANLWAN